MSIVLCVLTTQWIGPLTISETATLCAHNEVLQLQRFFLVILLFENYDSCFNGFTVSHYSFRNLQILLVMYYFLRATTLQTLCSLTIVKL